LLRTLTGMFHTFINIYKLLYVSTIDFKATTAANKNNINTFLETRQILLILFFNQYISSRCSSHMNCVTL